MFEYATAIEALRAKFPHLTIEVSEGKKYIKVIRGSVGTQSVYFFIEGATGAVYKAESWSRPAKGVRYMPTSSQDLADYLTANADAYGSFLYAR